MFVYHFNVDNLISDERLKKDANLEKRWIIISFLSKDCATLYQSD